MEEISVDEKVYRTLISEMNKRSDGGMLVALSLKHRRGTFVDLDGTANTVMMWYVYSMGKGPVKTTKDMKTEFHV